MSVRVFVILQGANRSNTSTSFDNFALSSSFAMLFIMTPMFMALTWYLDKVLPSEFGVPMHPLFFFQPSYWRKLCCSCRSSKSKGPGPGNRLWTQATGKGKREGKEGGSVCAQTQGVLAVAWFSYTFPSI